VTKILRNELRFLASWVGFLVGAGAALVLGTASRSWGQEAIYSEVPTPSSVDEVVTPMGRSFVESIPVHGLFPWFKEQLKDTDPFFRDTQLDLSFRTYYFNRHRSDDSLSEAWAMGGALSYRSGWLFDRFGVGAVLYTSQPVWAPGDRDGTDLLKPGQEGFTVLGQLYGRVKLFEGHFLNLYQYEYETPYMNRNDSRMAPKTFEGYTVNGAFGGEGDAPGLRYGFGYITRIKEKNSDTWDWMSEDAGAHAKRGVAVAGGRFIWGKFSVGGIEYYCDDVINIGYGEINYTVPVTDRIGLLLSTQFTDQRSVGRNLLTEESFSAQQFGVTGNLGYRGAILTIAYTANARGNDLQNPWSGYPGYTSSQITDFNRSGDNAIVTKLSYDFTGVGLPGVTAYALFAHGWGRVDSTTKDPLPNSNEFNADLQWRPQEGLLKGLWLRIRYGLVEQYGGPRNTQHDFRVIVNYGIPLL
jgi:hypothetical protein